MEPNNPDKSSQPPNDTPQSPMPETPLSPAPIPPESPVNYAPVPPAPQAAAVKEPVAAGVVILQWLTYAFWGWTVLALSLLTTMVFASFIGNSDSGSFTPYGIAAVLVLLPISYICDYLYSKHEPLKKTGVEMLVMVIHAVIFAIFAIGSLIVAVIALVMLFTSSGDSSGIQVGLYSALVITAYYILTFLRTLNPGFFPWIKRFYKIIMIVSVGVIALLGLIGPVAKERSRRDDKLIENNLTTVSVAINSYSRSNGKLPSDLKSLSLNGDARQLIDKNIVTYKPESTGTYKVSVSNALSDTGVNINNALKYQLCVTYKKESSNYGRYTSYYDDYGSEEYKSYLSAYSHPAGSVCYKLQTTSY